MSGAAPIAGVELGGTKCVVVLASPEGAIAARETVPTTDPAATLGAIEAVLARWWGESGFAALGIASFGPVALDPAMPGYGSITSTPKPGWRNTDLVGRLGARFPVPIAFDTDVNGAARAEGRWGTAQGLNDFAYVTVGTGIGVGLIVHGRPTRGIGHCELGHMRVARLPGDDWPGTCPYHGDCAEGLAAGPAIAARAGCAPGTVPAADDPVWESVAHALAQMCQAMVLATGPVRILMGGGVANGQPQLIPQVEALLIESLAGYVALPEDRPYIRAPGLGDLAGPLGPIALALDRLGATND